MKNRYFELLDTHLECIKSGKVIGMVNLVDSINEQLGKGEAMEYYIDGQGWVSSTGDQIEAIKTEEAYNTYFEEIQLVKKMVDEDKYYNPDAVVLADEDGVVTKESIQAFEDKVAERDTVKEEMVDEVPTMSELEEEVTQDLKEEKMSDAKEETINDEESTEGKQEDKTTDEGLSTTAKVIIGVASVAAIGGALWFGAKKLVESVPTATVVDID